MSEATVTIARRFRGPTTSGNGGYVCGLLASHAHGDVVVRLSRPPPLERPLEILRTATGVELRDADARIAETRPSRLAVETPEAPGLAEARAASRRYPGFHEHWFPQCFVCGPMRTPGDGLRIFPGPLVDRALHAAAWTPDASLSAPDGTVRPEFVWAALDCPGAFACHRGPEQSPVVLGELEARLEAPIHAGEPCVVIAWPLGAKGRKHFAGSALFSTRNGRCAVARAVWIEVPPARRGDVPGRHPAPRGVRR